MNRAEWEQSTIRIAVAIFLLGYSVLFNLIKIDAPVTFESNGIFISSLFLFSSLILHGWTLVNLRPQYIHYRRIAGIAMDNGFLTVALITTGEIAGPLFAIYLWVAFSNGFRFGVRYLVGSALIALCGFIAVYALSPYWQANTPMWVGMLIALVILPPYIGLLLNREQKAKQRVEEAKQRAEEANQAKSQFLARVTHELRTPLNAVIGISELLTSIEMKRESKGYCKLIQDSGQHLLRIINDILDAAKLESNEMVFESVLFDLHNIVNSCVESFRLEAKKKGLSLGVSFDLDLPHKMVGDPHRIRQILVNIIGNAIKFTEAGHVSVTVGGKSITAQNQQVTFLISDTGIGMAQTTIDRIAEPFSQADASTTRKYGGTGLGMSISKHLINQMQGTLSVESSPGRGSAFTINIPFEINHTVEYSAEIQGARWLVLSTGQIEPRLQSHLDMWGVVYILEQDPHRAIALLHGQRVQDKHIDGLLIIQPKAFAQNALEKLIAELTSMDYTLPVSLIEISDGSIASPFHAFERYSLIDNPTSIDYTRLFNAIHSGTISLGADGNITPGHRIRKILKDINILVAEDYTTNANILQAMLNRVDLQPTIVRDGQRLLDELTTGQWDLAISDLCMPNIDGIEAFQLYRAMVSSENEVPFILLTANTDEATLQRASQAGIKHYLSKPVNLAGLFDCIENALKETASSGTLPAKLQPTITPTDRSVEIIDTNVAEQAFNLNPSAEYRQQIYTSYVQDTNQHLTAMQVALDGGNLEEFASHAHAIKGSSGYLGLNKMGDLARQGQELNPNTDWQPRAKELLEQTRETWPATLQALDAYLTSRGIGFAGQPPATLQRIF